MFCTVFDETSIFRCFLQTLGDALRRTSVQPVRPVSPHLPAARVRALSGKDSAPAMRTTIVDTTASARFVIVAAMHVCVFVAWKDIIIFAGPSTRPIMQGVEVCSRLFWDSVGRFWAFAENHSGASA